MNTCKMCKHYRELDAAKAGRPVLLGGPKRGECRESIHGIPWPVALPGGEMDVQVRVLYLPVPEDLEACGRYEERGADQ